MRILSDKKLLVVHSYKGSFENWQKAGILRRELLLYQKLGDEFGEVVFVSFSANKELESRLAGQDVKVLVNRWSLPAWLYALSAWFLHRKELKKIDIIKTNQMSSALLALWIKIFFPRKKLVARCGFQWSQFQRHANFIKKIFVRAVERAAYKLSSHIIVASSADKLYVESQYGINGARISIISNLIDTDRFAPSGKPRSLKRICAVGRLEEQKNFDVLIRAMKGIDGELHIYGAGSLKQSLQTLADKLGAKVAFHGRVANDLLAKELDECGIFVLPSAYEGNPKSLLEAMSLGLAVIASDIEAHRAIIQNGENGVLVKADADLLCQEIVSLIGDDKKIKALGESARKYIVENASLGVVVRNELKVYQTL